MQACDTRSISSVLSMMGPKWSHVVDAIIAGGALPDLDPLYSRIESISKRWTRPATHSVLLVKKSLTKRYGCGKTGHIQANCKESNSKGNTVKTCKVFRTSRGCLKGRDCKFVHEKPENVAVANEWIMAVLTGVPE